jgi:Rieske 2Fe-2S family protein
MSFNNKLPIDAYINPDFFALEQKYIFSATWAFAGFVEELKIPGDYLTLQAGLNNIFVIKASDGEMFAFHNMCRHRGTQLIEGKGNKRNKLVCPYHDWTYDLKGNLLSLPKAKKELPNLDKTCHGLKKANVGIWRGMIWVHPDPNSHSIDEWFSPITAHLGPHKVEELVESKDNIVIEEINANWKVVVENYIDHYHLAHLHSGTLNMYDHKRAEFGFEGHHFRFWEPLVKDYQQNIERNSPYPPVYDFQNEKLGTWVPMLFPGIGLAESESSWSTFHIIPLAVDKTKVVIRTKIKSSSTVEYLKQSVSSASYWRQRIKAKSAQYDQKHALGSANIMQEDIYVCEQLQKSLSSPYFEFGPSAEEGERPIRVHQQLVWEIIKPHWK